MSNNHRFILTTKTILGKVSYLINVKNISAKISVCIVFLWKCIVSYGIYFKIHKFTAFWNKSYNFRYIYELKLTTRTIQLESVALWLTVFLYHYENWKRTSYPVMMQKCPISWHSSRWSARCQLPDEMIPKFNGVSRP